MKPFCRICLEEDEENLISPCECKGSCEFVHQECLMEWISQDERTECEICKSEFKYTMVQTQKETHATYITHFLLWCIIGYILTLMDDIRYQYIIYPFMHLLVLVGSSIVRFKDPKLVLVSTVGFLLLPVSCMLENAIGFTGACASDVRCPFYTRETKKLQSIILFLISELFLLTMISCICLVQHTYERRINRYLVMV